MIRNQQTLNDIPELQQTIQETGEIMVYLTQTKQQKDISQINKQFQGTLMNKVIPKELFEFFNRKAVMEKETYEKEIHVIKNDKQEHTKYMQTLQIIYQLLERNNLCQDYISFLLGFIERKPDFSKSNSVVLMYRMRMTAIIMLEHYLKFKNAHQVLIDFNSVWNSLFSNIVKFTRKHSTQKMNFVEQPHIVSRCELIIKTYNEEQRKFNCKKVSNVIKKRKICSSIAKPTQIDRSQVSHQSSQDSLSIQPPQEEQQVNLPAFLFEN